MQSDPASKENGRLTKFEPNAVKPEGGNSAIESNQVATKDQVISENQLAKERNLKLWNLWMGIAHLI